jgi:hypothetical protein
MTMKLMTTLGAAATLALFSTLGAAKLPAPSDEAKAKAAETAAKTAHTGKVDGYKLCKSMDSVAAAYYADAKKAGKDAKPATATPPCADPGAFVYPPPVPASGAVAAAPAAAPAAVPAAAASAKPAAVATAPKK